MSEAGYMRRVMLAAQRAGMWLFRNNVGVYFTHDGRRVRCGLAVGSSDLIGWTQHTVTADDVGRTLAVFTAVETKTSRGRLTQEQINFIEAVRASGGYAAELREGTDINTALAGIGKTR